ncbi:MAG TPA: hypothetical protein P5092_13955 [Ruminococcus sp.]|nr:hypothetical protein [Ruminococcus sp.]
MPKNDEKTAFEVFDDDSPQRKDPNAQLIYDYEKHYMDLLSSHKEDINFISELLKETRKEQIETMSLLDKINAHLIDQSVDDEVRIVWLKHFSENLSKSFELSNCLIEHFTTSQLSQFKTELRKRMKK